MKIKRSDDAPEPLCSQAGEVAPYLQNRLSAEARARFEAHLTECAICRAATQGAAPVIQTLATLPAVPMRDLTADILRRLPADAWATAAGAAPRRGFAPWLVRLAAGVVLALGLAGAWVALHGRRLPEARQEAARAAAVHKGLAWLQTTQESDGHWDPSKWGAPRQYTIGITALALLALDNARESGVARTGDDAARAGLTYLQAQQADDGHIGPAFSGLPYNHALATLAWLHADAAARTADWTNHCRRAVATICACQTEAGGWGYGYGGGDAVNASVTVWQLQALLAAQARGFVGLERTITRGIGWLVRAVNDQGWLGYARSGDFPYGYETMTAAGLLCLLRTSSPAQPAGTVDRMIEAVLTARGADGNPRDYCRSYFLVRALDLTRREEAQRLASRVRAGLLATQDARGGEAGSWPPVDRWSSEGGRVYATAMSVLALNDRPR